MVDPQGNQTLAAFLRGFIAVIGLVALLAPSFGPLIDHHFAERDPNHFHIYLGSHQSHHVHYYDAPHVHHPSDVSVHSEAPGQIVFLTSTDAFDMAMVSLGAAPTDADLVIHAHGDAESMLGFFDRDNPLKESLVILPEKPPRV